MGSDKHILDYYNSKAKDLVFRNSRCSLYRDTRHIFGIYPCGRKNS